MKPSTTGGAEQRGKDGAAAKGDSSRGWKLAALSIGSLLLMAYIDYVTGYELIFSAAYLIPVSVCAWHFGRKQVVWMSIACGVASWYVDTLSGHGYSNGWVLYWNASMCFGITLVTGLLLLRLRGTMAEERRTNRELEAALKELRRSTDEVRKLQNGLQVVCAWTQRIKVGEQWMSPEEFLRTQLHLNLTHGMSPEASQDFERAAGARNDAASSVRSSAGMHPPENRN